MATLTVNEIFHSIQGESSHMGRPCVFVRPTSCNLRCNYCDTECAFSEVRPVDLVTWILEERVPVRFKLRMHKYVREPASRRFR